MTEIGNICYHGGMRAKHMPSPIPLALFGIYVVALIVVMVFKTMPIIRIGSLMLNFSGSYDIHPANLVPFKTIGSYILGQKGWIIAGVNLAGNVLPFVPLGFLLPLLWRNMNWKKALAGGVFASVSIEVSQTVLKVGIFDIDDILLNAFGVVAGYWASILLIRWIRTKNYTAIVVASTAILIAGIGAMQALLPKAPRFVNESAQSAATIPGGRQCYAYSHTATADAPYNTREFIDMTVSGTTVQGSKRGTQQGPDMSNGYEGTLSGTVNGDTITVLFSYTIEGSRQTEREIYRASATGIEKLRYPLIEQKGTLVPDMAQPPSIERYDRVGCGQSD